MNRSVPALSLALPIFLVAFAALVAAGCGGDDAKPKQQSADAPEPVALGMDEDVVCTVDDAEIASEDVEDLADEAQGAFEQAYEDIDVDEVELDGYDGTLDTFEMVALDQLIDAELVRRAAEDLDVDVDEEDAREALESLAEDADLDVDELLEAIEDATGFGESTLVEANEQSTRLAEAFDELDADTADEFEDGRDWVKDELRPEGADDVRCGDGIEWDEDLRDDLQLPGGETVAFGDVVNDLITGAVEAATKPDPVELAIEYEDAVVPVLEDFNPLLVRFGSVIEKLNSGDIDLNRVAQGLGRQAKEMRTLHAKAARIRSADPYLQRNHQRLVTVLDAYTKSLVALRELATSTSQAQVDAREKAFTREINRADKALVAWATGLDDDPQDRPFTRSALMAAKLVETTESFD